MNRIPALALLALLSATPLFGQTSQSDSQTLQQILVEIRGMHNDVRLGQTTQILLAEYQVQQGVVTRATQRRDDLRTKLTQIQSTMKMFDTQIAQDDENAGKLLNPAQNKHIADMAKSTMISMKKQEQDTTNDLQDAENALAKEQSTLTDIKDQLDDIVKKLQPAGN
jgi:hypothetical protein